MNVDRYEIEAALLLMGSDGDCFRKISDVGTIAAILHRTKYWTNSVPFLDKTIYDYVGRYSSQIVRGLGGAGLVDEIVLCKIIKNWKSNTAASHLISVHYNILSCHDLNLLLILYLRVLQQGAIQVRNFPGEKTITQVGLAKVEDGQLKPASAIYTHIFNTSWIEEQIPGLTRPIVDKQILGDRIQT
jgi:hypothetical protein